jgi:hypothetical protein
MSYDDLIKFRSTSDLVARLERIAKQQRRDLPDLLRLVLEDYAKEQEQELQLAETTTPYKTEGGLSSARQEEIGAEALKIAKKSLAKTKEKKPAHSK